MLLEISPYHIDDRKIDQVVGILQKGGIIIYPTDTVYSMACSLNVPKSIKELARIKGIKPKRAQFSLICKDLSSLSEYTKSVSRPIFKIMNKALPGPYTFILNASNAIPKLFDSSKKTVGIRIPNNEITLMIIDRLGAPLVSTSIHDDDDILEYTTDPYSIHENYAQKVGVVIDGGYGNNEASTVIDCTKDEIEIIREGLGNIDDII